MDEITDKFQDQHFTLSYDMVIWRNHPTPEYSKYTFSEMDYTLPQPEIPPRLKSPKPTSAFLKVYKQNLAYLLETSGDPSLYLPATKEEGEKYRRTNYVRDLNGDPYALFCSIKEFKKYGVGVYLLFLFLRCILVVSLIKSLVAIGSMIVIKNSREEQPEEQLLTSLSLASLVPGSSQKNTILALDTTSTVISILFLVFWNQIQKRVVVDCAEVAPLPSYYTVRLTQLPKDFNPRNDLEGIIRRFGPVEEVYTIRDHIDLLFYYKVLVKTLQKIKIEMAEVQLDETRDKTYYYQLMEEFNIIYLKVKRLQNNYTSSPVQVLISFRTIKAREETVKYFTRQPFKCVHANKSDKVNSRGLLVERCYVEPTGIIWENIHISQCDSYKKFLIQIVLVVVVFGVGFASILFCSIFETAMGVDPEAKEDKHIHCIELNIVAFAQQRQKCSQDQMQYFLSTLISLAIPLLIILIKVLITKIIEGLAYFRRFGTIIDRIRSQLLTCWIVCFTSTTLIIPVIHISIGDFTFNSIMFPVFNSIWPSLVKYKSIKTYEDFDMSWYNNVGHSIVLTGFLSFGTGYFGNLVWKGALRRINDYRARRERIQARMNRRLRGETLEVALLLAQALALVSFVEFYSVGLPLLHVLGTVSLTILYLCSKTIFLRLSSSPPIFNQTINRSITKFVLLSIVLHNLMSPQLLSITDLDAPPLFYQRWWYYKSYSILSIISTTYYLGRSFIASFLIKVWKVVRGDYSRESALPFQINNIDRTFKEALKVSKKELVSYRMDESPKYMDILKAMYALSGTSAIHAYKNDILIDSTNQFTSETTHNNEEHPTDDNISVLPFFGITSQKVLGTRESIK